MNDNTQKKDEPAGATVLAFDHVSTPAQREKWSKKQEYKLDRQSKPITMDEMPRIGSALLLTYIDFALIGCGPFAKATGMRIARLSPGGTIGLMFIDSVLKVGDEPLACIDIMATDGFDKFDIRFLGFHGGDTSEEAVDRIPDRQYLGGLTMFREVRDVKLDDLLATIENVMGVAIRNPDPKQQEALKAARLEAATERCQCPDCTIARERAKANGTKAVDERELIDAMRQKENATVH